MGSAAQRAPGCRAEPCTKRTSGRAAALRHLQDTCCSHLYHGWRWYNLNDLLSVRAGARFNRTRRARTVHSFPSSLLAEYAASTESDGDFALLRSLVERRPCAECARAANETTIHLRVGDVSNYPNANPNPNPNPQYHPPQSRRCA